MKTITAEHVESFRKMHYELIDRPSFGWKRERRGFFRWVTQGIYLLCNRVNKDEWRAELEFCWFPEHRQTIVIATGRTRAEAARNALDAGISKALKP